MVLGCKRIHKPGRTIYGFSRSFVELCGSKARLASPPRNFINGIANPENVYQSHVLALCTSYMGSSCWWCKSRELGNRRSPIFPFITPVKESFSSDFFQAIISYWAMGSQLESCQTSCQTSTMELFCENSQRP